MIEIENCKICNNKIDPNEYFTNKDKSYYLCSEECADKIKDEDNIKSNIVLLMMNVNN